MVPPELFQLVGAVLDSLDAILDEPDHALSLDNVFPDPLVPGVFPELLVEDVQILVFPLQTLFQGSKEFRVLELCFSPLNICWPLQKVRKKNRYHQGPVS